MKYEQTNMIEEKKSIVSGSEEEKRREIHKSLAYTEDIKESIVDNKAHYNSILPEPKMNKSKAKSKAIKQQSLIRNQTQDAIEDQTSSRILCCKCIIT